MPTSTYDYMVPGVNTVVEFPERLFFSQRFGWGLYVEQTADPDRRHNNWFHLGVPYIMSDRPTAGCNVSKLYLNIELNENARLAEIHLRAGRHLIWRTEPRLIGTVFSSFYEVPRAGASLDPFIICMRIEFLSGTPVGSVTFVGAGLEVTIADTE